MLMARVPPAGAHALPVIPGLTSAAWAGVALIAGATLAGAWLGRRTLRAPAASLAAVAGVLLAVVLADLVPDIWHDLSAARLPWVVAPLAVAASFTATGVLVRRGCACRPGLAGGGATAVAIGVHRGLEGSALAVTASAPLIAALVMHAASEGFAVASLFTAGQRNKAVWWLIIACASPAAGAAALGAARLPAQATPILTALVVGALLRTALAAYQLAAPRGGTGMRFAIPLMGRPMVITTVTTTFLATALIALTHAP